MPLHSVLIVQKQTRWFSWALEKTPTQGTSESPQHSLPYSWGVDQWQSTCLVSVKPWAPLAPLRGNAAPPHPHPLIPRVFLHPDILLIQCNSSRWVDSICFFEITNPVQPASISHGHPCDPPPPVSTLSVHAMKTHSSEQTQGPGDCCLAQSHSLAP